VSNKNIYVRGHSLYFIRLMQKLLRNDPQLLKLFRTVPFKEAPPKWVRARFFQYHFTSPEEFRETRLIWKRELLGEYCPVVSLNDLV